MSDWDLIVPDSSSTDSIMDVRVKDIPVPETEHSSPEKPRIRAQPVPRNIPINDIQGLLDIVASVYHFDKGVRLHGVVFPLWQRVDEWLKKQK